MDQPPPLPKRIVWFAPWTWSLSTQLGFVKYLIAGWFVSWLLLQLLRVLIRPGF